MDLKTFVAETLKQIVAGVAEAQDADGGDAINAQMKDGGPLPGRLIPTTFGMFTCVDFDVAVSAEGVVGGRDGLMVYGVGLKADGEHKTGYANRIAFSVPVLLTTGKAAPKGEQAGFGYRNMPD